MRLTLLYENKSESKLQITMLTLLDPGHFIGKPPMGVTDDGDPYYMDYQPEQLNKIVNQPTSSLYKGLIKTLSSPLEEHEEEDEWDTGSGWKDTKPVFNVDQFLHNIKIYKKPTVEDGDTIYCWFTAYVDNIEILNNFVHQIFEEDVEEMLRNGTLYLRHLTSKNPDIRLQRKLTDQ